ncbi:MAG: DinB family protein [Chloroflexi bacterium]|uniref:DinB family protein n=1 Tax=Candidatus Chlorohelix allophototropha TaxID=3003348 RepID=A0A8T7LV84_9CHLR|nr:DinB family protein [Chloroflexota bacterium]WJW67799.1 DinB family protein [Chloroflexota bacterium L227-S17]
MDTLLAELKEIIERVSGQLRAIVGAQVAAPGEWSKKQLLGHLIDSATNNHQRFVRVQLEAELRFPGYRQEEWVAVQHYQAENWEELVLLWESCNRHLLHLVRYIPQDALSKLCYIGEGVPITVQTLFSEYLTHMKGHLAQLLS